jgi:hypothetical protein
MFKASRRFSVKAKLACDGYWWSRARALTTNWQPVYRILGVLKLAAERMPSTAATASASPDKPQQSIQLQAAATILPVQSRAMAPQYPKLASPPSGTKHQCLLSGTLVQVCATISSVSTSYSMLEFSEGEDLRPPVLNTKCVSRQQS